MQDFKEIIEKLKDILSKELGNVNIQDKNIAEALDIKYDNFRKAKQHNRVPYYPIMQFLAKRQISINYFFFNQLPESLIDQTDKFALLKYQSTITTTAGYGGINYYLDPQPIVVDKQLLDHINSSYKYTELLQVTGDSMLPDIKENSLIFVDRSKQEIDSKSIYVVNTLEGLLIKRIEYKEDEYILKSSNKEYQDIKIKDINIIGKVTGILTKL